MQVDATRTSNQSALGAQVSGATSGFDAAKAKDEFLTLLTTQLENQDPLNPQEHHEFVAQLAQFSALEQQINTNERIAKLTEMQQSMANGQLAQLIGKEISVQGKHVSITNKTPQPISVDLPAAAATVRATIRDANGQTVDVVEMRNVNAGRHSFDWDGRTSDGTLLPDGRYTVDLEATSSTGDKIAVTSVARGRVDAVSFENGYAELIVGGARILPADIISIHDPKPASDTETATGGSNKASQAKRAYGR